MPAIFMGLSLFFKDTIVFMVPFIFKWFVRSFLIKVTVVMTTIGAWYGFYSLFISYVNEKFAALAVDSPAFRHPVWLSVSSMFPDNLLPCLNILTVAFSLYFAFRVKSFLLGRLTSGLIK